MKKESSSVMNSIRDRVCLQLQADVLTNKIINYKANGNVILVQPTFSVRPLIEISFREVKNDE